MRTIIFISLVVNLFALSAQDKGKIQGRLFNAKNNEPIPFANIVITGTNIGSTSDIDGNYLFEGVKPGSVSLTFFALGFETLVTDQIMITNARTVFFDVPMTENVIAIAEVVINASSFKRNDESPLSLRRVSISEIEKSPGGNRDISKVIQSLPGVASTPAFRNDVIVRGGGSAENRFYLDGVEIPNLNHFSTQGASGGPVGIINVDFIREVDFYSSAFPANRGNALSSILEFKQLDGNREKFKTRTTLGASDLALTLDGPMTDNTTLIFSARRSYLQFLFTALGLPFLPTYNDFQFKTKTRIDDKNELTFIGLGAIDQNKLNTDANETPSQRIILAQLPENNQWNYTIGGVYKHFGKNGFDSYVVSRNFLNNSSYKYKNNDENLPKTFDYVSTEAETKFRYEKTLYNIIGYKINYGVGAEYAEYYNSTQNNILIGDSLVNLKYESRLDMVNYNAFAQISKKYLAERLTLSLGSRVDGSSYSSQMSNPLQQFSPRFSVSYGLTRNLSLNASTGRFYQRPPYTTLGYKDNSGELVNRKNGIRYIQSDHLVGGIEWLPNSKSVISLEGFYKNYAKYPFSLADSISISGKGADFGTFGDEAVISIAEGKSYGLEVLARSKDIVGFNAILSYTLVWSEFNDIRTNQFIPTAWDNRHILNITLTRAFKRNWDVGMKWRYVGGAPYTPVDEYKSSLVYAWDARQSSYLDYSRFNTQRNNAFHQLDIRVDKSYYFNKWSLMLYVDIQNLYGFKADQPDVYTRQAFLSDSPLPNDDRQIDPNTGEQVYPMQYIDGSAGGTVLPTIGIILEF